MTIAQLVLLADVQWPAAKPPDSFDDWDSTPRGSIGDLAALARIT